jgi:hypothetical protein
MLSVGSKYVLAAAISAIHIEPAMGSANETGLSKVTQRAGVYVNWPDR